MDKLPKSKVIEEEIWAHLHATRVKILPDIICYQNLIHNLDSLQQLNKQLKIQINSLEYPRLTESLQKIK